jgi:hypothetical protein
MRIDFHAHLYDSYQVQSWCQAAIANFQLRPGVGGVLVVVDRQGQDSFARLKREVAEFGSFVERPTAQSNSEQALLAEIVVQDKTLYIVRGVQYVSAERLEVLGLGVARSIADGRPVAELIKIITQQGGIPCLPWSPGKWLGSRGKVVARALKEGHGTSLTFGDIAIRSRVGPPSTLLSRARRAGFPVVCGTDPLPRKQDCGLVGSYGLEFGLAGALELEHFLTSPSGFLINKINSMRVWGGPNSGLKSLLRFLSSL